MQRPHADRVHDLMRRAGRSCWELTELAAALGPPGPSPEALARELETDPRFRLMDPPAVVPHPARWSAAERAAYGPALRRAGLGGGPVVVLIGEADAGPDSPARLLDRTMARLATAEAAAGDPPPDVSDAVRSRRLLDLV